MLDAAATERAAATLRDQSPERILAWAAETFPGKVALSLSFGGPGVAMAHMLSTIDRTVPVLFIDTGMLFAETLAFKDAFATRYGLTVRTLHPDHDPGPLYETDPDACCGIRRVGPMQRALGEYDAWVSGLRRDQSASRGTIEAVEYHAAEERPIVKIYPLAYWSRAQVWRYLQEHGVPHHPLLDQGYTSLGCWPCTRPNADATNERAGRWAGTAKTECGLHTFTTKGAPAAVAGREAQ
jgi:phosphoadenosine phosphosulfate reductase